MEVTTIVSKSGMYIVGLLLLCCLPATTSAQSYLRRFQTILPGPLIPHDYTRFADVARRCEPALSSAAELDAVDADRAAVLMQQLSFCNGDWSQDAGGRAPLMPFQGSYADATPVAGQLGPRPLEVLHLASFMPTHMDAAAAAAQRGGVRTALNVSGFATFTVTRDRCCQPMDPRVSPEFELRPGVANLHVVFEGVYTETTPSGDGGGERVLCMVGNAVLPVRGGNSSDPWDWAKAAKKGGFVPPVTGDGNVLLVLRYPKTSSLTTRAVLGEMTSTSAKSARAYFDTVRLVSQHGQFSRSRYQFRPEGELDVNGCSNHPSFSEDDGGGSPGHLYRGASFCDILDGFRPGGDDGVLAVVPNWRCNSTDELCSRLGPFETAATGSALLARSGVAMQSVRCEPTSDADGAAAARVSAVFRAVPPWEHRPTAARRTGLSGTTLSAEGVWRASTGRLCMAACLGAGGDPAASSCRYRVSLHVATAFTITRRGVIVGQIASTNRSDDDDSPPLSFQLVILGQQKVFGPDEESVPMVYNYTKFAQAGDLLRRAPPSWFRDSFVARSLLRYPSIAGAADDTTSLSDLANDLGLRLRCVPKLPFLPEWTEEPVDNFYLHFLSIGPLIGSYSPSIRQGESSRAVIELETDYGAEKHQMLNVSAYFAVGRFSSRTVMWLEGVFNPEDGRMCLIGCRNVEAPWRVSDLEDGMDCSIEVTVEYPTMTTRWLVSPAAKVYVASTRDAADPLYFNRTELRTPPVTYRGHRDVLDEYTVERLLCIAMLSAAITATLIQLRYLKSHADVAPFVSLAMLGVQALGYAVTLVTEARMLPAWPTYHSRISSGYLHWDMDASVRALTLAALLLTARLAHKVRRARARARARSPLEPGRVPGDAAVLLRTIGVHACGLFFLLAAHWLSTRGTPPEVGATGLPASQMRTRGAVVERYVGVVKEWFLLPQVVGNAVWRVNCKPLAGRYYAGVAAVWLLPHVYRYLRPPLVNMYPVVPNDTMDFYAKAFDVVVPVVGVALAHAVYVQQRWNYKIVGWAMGTERTKLQHIS